MKVILGLNAIHRDGMGSVAVTLLRALRAEGIEAVALHAWREIDLPGYEAEFAPRFVEGLAEYRVDGEAIARLVAAVDALADEGDVFIHTGSPNWAACIPYFKGGVRVVTGVHNINPSTLKLCRAFANRVSAFVCVSYGVRSYFQKWLPRALWKRIYVIANAVDFVKVAKADYTPHKPLRVVYTGRIEDTSKGCGKLPLIFAELKRRGVAVELDLYGYFHNWETQFWRMVACEGVEEIIHYCGEINHSELSQRLIMYDVFIVPSNIDGFNLSLAEAMMAGLPCVSSSIMGVTEWLLDGGAAGLLVEKMDIQGFADALERLSKEPGLAEKLGRAARARISELASFEAHGRAYEQLFRMVSASQEGVVPPQVLDAARYVFPSCLKPWGPARLLPTWLKTWLRRFM